MGSRSFTHASTPVRSARAYRVLAMFPALALAGCAAAIVDEPENDVEAPDSGEGSAGDSPSHVPPDEILPSLPLGGNQLEGGPDSDPPSPDPSDPGTGGADGGITMVGSGGSASTGTCVPVPTGPFRDADSDGVIDALDPDDDNDGNTDIKECFPVVQRFTNPSFEVPVIEGRWAYVPAGDVPGWQTTETTNQLELWSTGTYEIESRDGSQHLELTGHEPSTVSQEIATIPHTTVRYAFHHRGRAGEDTFDLYIGAPGRAEFQKSYTTGQAWIQYEGTYVVPAGQTLTRFEFRSLVPDLSSGNHLDWVDAEPICLLDRDGDGCVDTEDPE